jgi:hypothetical protein
MVFRGNGYVDAGGRFADIEERVEVSAKNYIKTVTDAIKKSIKSHDVTDEYIEQKKKQEQQQREEYYQANREKLMQSEPDVVDMENEIAECDSLKAAIKQAINGMDADGKKTAQTKIKANGLPTSYNKLTDPDILQKILNLITE